MNTNQSPGTFLRCLLLHAGSLVAGMAPATPVWQWTDAGGQQHYSDTAPVTGSGRLLGNTGSRSDEAPPTGLRRREVEGLRRIERRLQHQHDRAARQREAQARANRAQREHCRSTRSRWRDARDRDLHSTLGDYLRRNCW